MLRIAAVLVLAAVLATAAAAGEYKVGDLRIDGAFARATPAMAKNGAAYFAVENHGVRDDRLLAARAAVAERAELHAHVQDGGVMRMRPVDGGIAVPAGGRAELAPGGLHVMLMNLRAPLRAGESFPLTLVFERAGEITVEVPVRGIAAGGHGASHGGGHHHR